MPTRIIREGIISSEAINRLSFEAELFYRRLMSVADDYGRYYAHPGLLRAACYPLKLETVSERHVKQLLSECVAAFVIVLYGAEKYLQIIKFRQQTRATSKFPEPSADELLIICKAEDNQMRSESESESDAKAKSLLGVPPAPKRFEKPSPGDVSEYAKSIQFNLVGEKFCDFYEAKGWVVGKSPMKDWRAAVRTWKRSGYGNGGGLTAEQTERKRKLGGGF